MGGVVVMLFVAGLLEGFGRQLITCKDVDIFEPPFEPHFEQRDRDLARIGGGAAI